MLPTFLKIAPLVMLMVTTTKIFMFLSFRINFGLCLEICLVFQDHHHYDPRVLFWIMSHEALIIIVQLAASRSMCSICMSIIIKEHLWMVTLNSKNLAVSIFENH